MVFVLATLANGCANGDARNATVPAAASSAEQDARFPRLPAVLQMPDCDACGQLAIVPEGTCLIGSPPEEKARWERREEPQHEVHVPSFALGRTEVTQAQWMAIMGDVNPHEGTFARLRATLKHWVTGEPYNPSGFAECGGACPVENVSWDDAQVFIERLNASSGQHFRLPTDAEWECAARAGGTERYGEFKTIDGSRANYNTAIPQEGETARPSVGMPVRADSFEPNAYGLYNMQGNVWEWAQDCWNPSHDGAPTDGSARTTGDCTQRSLRGGSWIDDSRRMRPAHRSKDKSDVRMYFQGFRLARSAP